MPYSAAPRLLVGYDGKPPATEALLAAAEIARWRHGHVSVVMVPEHPWLARLACLSPSPVPRVDLEAYCAERLRRAIATLPADLGVRWVIRRGDVAGALAAEAEAAGCDSILIGVPQRRGRRRLAAAIRSRCHMPVEEIPVCQEKSCPSS